MPTLVISLSTSLWCEYNSCMQKLLPYLASTLIVILVTAVKVVLNKLLGLDSPVLLFFMAVTICAWWGGLRQGIWAYLVSILAIRLVFLTNGQITDLVWISRLALFSLDCFVVIYLCSRLHRSNKQLQKVYQSMEASEKSLRKIFESNMIGLVFSDFQGQLVEANDYFLDILKTNRKDLNAGKLNWKKFTPPEHMDTGVLALEKLKSNAPVVPFEKQYMRADGSRVTVLVGAAPVDENKVVAFILDISDRKIAQDALSALNNRLEDSVSERTIQLTDMNDELSKLVRESIVAEDKLRQSESFLDSVIDHIPNMVFVKRASDLRFVRFNKAGEELLGHTQEELLGKSDYDFFPKEQADFFTEKDRHVLEGKTVVDIAEEPLATKFGMRYLHTKKIPIVDRDLRPIYLLGISEDITERKEAEKQRSELLHEQSARWEAEKSASRLAFLSEASGALNTSLDISVMVSAFLEVVTEQFAHFCSVDLLTGKADNLWHLERTSGGDVMVGEKQNTDALSGEVSLVISSRLSKITERRLYLPLIYREEMYGCMTITAPDGHTYDKLDVTMAEDLARRAATAIENATLFSKAQEASRTKSAFLANMSHEIRTPLGAMLGFAELALDDSTLNTDQVNNLATILRNGQQLLRIVDEVLDLSKVESERIDIESINVNLPKLLSEVNLLFSLKAEEKGLGFSVGPKGVLPEMVKTDPLRLRQIFINVVGNAIKFTEKGSVVVSVEYLANNAANRKGILEVLVTDTGIGMTAEQTAKLFQPFVQADQTMTRKYGGTGLGLFLSRKLAALMGGEVTLNFTRTGEGSQFKITIPLEAVRPTVSSSDLTTSGKIQWASKLPENGKVLVVDDALENRVLVNAFLTKMGVSTEQASNGQEGVEKAIKGQFDVVLMDIQMPVMDGFEAVKRLREAGYTKTIVALTAHAMKGDREKCLSSGFDDYLCKPLSRDALAQCLMQHMQHKFDLRP